MKLSVIIISTIISVAILLSGCDKQATPKATIKSADEILKILSDPSDPYVFTMAHRADWRYAPENSLEGINHCLSQGVEFLEIDIRSSNDGHYVLMHDLTLDRTTNGKGNVADWDLDSLKVLKLFNGYKKSGESIPTLEEVLSVVKGRALIKLDKSSNDILKVYPILKKHHMLNYCFFYGQESYSDLRNKLGPYLDSIQYIPQVSSENASLDYIQDFIVNMNPPMFEFFFNSIKDSHLPLIKSVLPNARVLVASTGAGWYAPNEYTDENAFSDPDENWGRLIDLGASIIITDSPFRLRSYLQNRFYDQR